MMKLKILLLIGLLSLLCSDLKAAEPEWLTKIRQVRLLSDTRNDVFRKFEKKMAENEEMKLSSTFELEGGQIFVVFASGICPQSFDGNERVIRWTVPAGTVIGISYIPRNPFSPKVLPFDLSHFPKKKIQDSVNAFDYDDPEQGINVAVNSNGRVESLGFYPSKRFDHLLCSK